MKRGLALFGMLLFLAGCSPAGRTAVDTAELLSRPFTAQVRLNWDGEEYAGSMGRNAQGETTLSLTGETLGVPVSFTCEEGGCAIAQGELVLTLNGADLPSTSLPSSVQRAFVLLQNTAAKEKEGELSFEAGAVRLTCRGDDLAFSRLDLERGEIEFTGFAFTDR